MPLAIGTRIGPYEITAAVGAGGMGEVYRAHDSRLRRDVAIKVAGEAFSERFTREARAIAALNHTNICHIYDVGRLRVADTSAGQGADVDVLVMEFVEGEELRGPVSFDDALPILRQLVDGIEAAHENNIIHRDLKPANIKLTPGGVVKILDFGLARAADPVQADDPSDAPTIAATVGGTAQGVILGTSAYMAPEQARGETADKRADIWSFGVIAYELLTGKRAFSGGTTVEILGAVLNKEPDLSVVQPRARKLLSWCLEKDRKRRLQAIGDARRLLDEDDVVPAATGPVAWVASTRAAWTKAALVAAIVALAVVSWLAFTPAPAPPERRLDIVTPATVDLASFALSPDGSQIVFAASGDGTRRLWLRPLDKATAQPLAGTEGGSYPFWSPDSRKVGFFADGKLKRLDLAGGSPQTLADPAAARGGAWNSEGTILFAQSNLGGLFRVRDSGGEAIAVTRLAKEATHRFPVFFPGGGEFLFYGIGAEDGTGIYVGSLDGGEAVRLVDADGAGVLLPGNWLLFRRGGVLVASRLVDNRRAVIGELVTVAETASFDPLIGASAVSVSDTGLIAFRSGAFGQRRQLTWFDRSGRPTGVLGAPDDADLVSPRLSPDGRRVAVVRTVQGNTDVWMLDADRASFLTRKPGADRYPVWSPGGDRVLFDSFRNLVRQLYWQAANGSAPDELLLETARNKAAQDWSPDGGFISFVEVQEDARNFDIWMLPLAGDRKPFPFVRTSADEQQPTFSRDGRSVAYSSNTSGRFEVYVKPFPGPGDPALISTAGGRFPRWAPGDKEIYYFAPDGTLMATPVTRVGAAIEPGQPVALFRPTVHGSGIDVGLGPQYDVSRDGRFLINVVLDNTLSAPITLIQNWKAP